jgi:Ca-activated chloride channel family protein
MNYRFEDPWWLLLALAAVVVAIARPARGAAAFAPYGLAAQLPRSRGPLVFRMLVASGLVLGVVALARPQWGQSNSERIQAGRDIMIVIDTSRSMEVDDLRDASGNRSDRLAAVFGAAKEFINHRQDDRIGLVFFASTAVTSCPLTYDHDTVLDFLDQTEKQQRWRWHQSSGNGENGESGFLGDATNIGLGLGYALRSLTDIKAKGRALILITDGADTKELYNWVDPLIAARKAVDLKVVMYGIGVGDPHGTITRHDMFGREIADPTPPNLLPDMDRLHSIVTISGGSSFQANDKPALQAILDHIDSLEPTEHAVKMHIDYSDHYTWPLILGSLGILCALAFEPRLRGVA